MEQLINARVHKYYWEDNINCAQTTLKILGEIFGVKFNEQVLDSAIGMHGAGRYGAQCGLVEGTLMFIGIFGKKKGLKGDKIADKCYSFAKDFEKEFGSLLCKVLRPEGFKKNNPPHLCESLTKKALLFSANYIKNNL